jgi:hypothetical protein
MDWFVASLLAMTAYQKRGDQPADAGDRSQAPGDLIFGVPVAQAPVERCDPRAQARMLFREPGEKRARQRRDVGPRQTLEEGPDPRRPLGGDEAKLGPMATDRIHELRALAHQPLALATSIKAVC